MARGHRRGEADVARRRAKARSAPEDYEGQRAYAVGLRPMGELYWAAGHKDQACATWRLTRAEWDRLAASGGLAGFDRTTEIRFLDGLVKSAPDRAPRPYLTHRPGTIRLIT